MSDLVNLYSDLFKKNTLNTNIIGIEILGGFAKIAADQFCNSNIPLNETIHKLAYENKLNPDQIGIVVCEANKAVHANLFSNSEDKYITFPLSDAKKIIDSLQINCEKTASNNNMEEDDYSLQPSYFKNREKFSSYTSCLKDEDLATIKHKLDREKIKVDKELFENDLNLFNLQDKMSQNISKFKKIAFELVLNEAECKYQDAFRILYNFTKTASNEDIANDLCLDLKNKIKKIILKEASFKNEEYIGNDVLIKCQVINSNHPLYIELNKINKNINEQETLKRKNTELHQIRKDLITRISKVV